MDNQSSIINTSQIDAISGGDNGFKIELINIFLEQIPEFSQKMKLFLKNEEWEKLAREAHTAKSSVLTFGMKETGALLKNIQNLANDNNLGPLPRMVEQALEHFDIAVPELEEIKKSLS